MSFGYSGFETEKMQAAVILTAATVTLALDKAASAGMLQCEADHQCDGGYCYLETGQCVPCIDCESYLRKISQWRLCARAPQDCGDCLAGFEHEYLTDGSTRSFCVRKKDTEYGLLNVRSPYIWIIIATILTIIILLLLVVIRFYKGGKARAVEQNNNPNPDPPPLRAYNQNEISPPHYESLVSLLQPSSYTSMRDVSPAVCTSLTVVEKGGGTLQQAVPFADPHPPYGTGGPNTLEIDLQDSEAEGLNQFHDYLHNYESGDEIEEPRSISPPQLEDEDTMPSNWAPFREAPAVSEEASPEECNSVVSSPPDISDVEDIASEGGQKDLNDSGVSASSSHHSDLPFAHVVGEIEIFANGQDPTTNNINTVLQRRHSEDDLSLSQRKRQRRDSGSSSIASGETYQDED